MSWKVRTHCIEQLNSPSIEIACQIDFINDLKIIVYVHTTPEICTKLIKTKDNDQNVERNAEHDNFGAWNEKKMLMKISIVTNINIFVLIFALIFGWIFITNNFMQMTNEMFRQDWCFNWPISLTKEKLRSVSTPTFMTGTFDAICLSLHW